MGEARETGCHPPHLAESRWWAPEDAASFRTALLQPSNGERPRARRRPPARRDLAHRNPCDRVIGRRTLAGIGTERESNPYAPCPRLCWGAEESASRSPAAHPLSVKAIVGAGARGDRV